MPSSSSLTMRSFASFLPTVASSEDVAVYSTLDWLQSAIVLRKRVQAPLGEKLLRSRRVLSWVTKPLLGSYEWEVPSTSRVPKPGMIALRAIILPVVRVPVLSLQIEVTPPTASIAEETRIITLDLDVNG